MNTYAHDMHERDHFTLLCERDRCVDRPFRVERCKHNTKKTLIVEFNAFKASHRKSDSSRTSSKSSKEWTIRQQWQYTHRSDDDDEARPFPFVGFLEVFWSDIVAFTLHIHPWRHGIYIYLLAWRVMAKQSSLTSCDSKKMGNLFVKCSRGHLLHAIIDSKNGINANFLMKRKGKTMIIQSRARTCAIFVHIHFN